MSYPALKDPRAPPLSLSSYTCICRFFRQVEGMRLCWYNSCCVPFNTERRRCCTLCWWSPGRKTWGSHSGCSRAFFYFAVKLHDGHDENRTDVFELSPARRLLCESHPTFQSDLSFNDGVRGDKMLNQTVSWSQQTTVRKCSGSHGKNKTNITKKKPNLK